jgi:3' terminal RNA ribose 2'-O-methyltransferase Hen1
LLLTITTTYRPATDLGYLLFKNPSEVQSFELTFGTAHIFYPVATIDRCTAALLLDIDPIGLVRNRRGPSGEGHQLEQYVNDRPYVASSFLSVAINEVFGTALSGRSRERPDLAETVIPLEASLPCVPCRGGENLLRKLFEPLGYTVTTHGHALNPKFPEWGQSRYFSATLNGNRRLSELLAHIYVLIPVLDNDKHYWVGEAEVEKLLRHGKKWLSDHPEKELITSRYLKHSEKLTTQALSRLTAEESADPDAEEELHGAEEAVLEERISLNQQRIGQVIGVLRDAGAKRIIDLGCGEGKLIKALLENKDFTELVGFDISHRALEIASQRLRLAHLPDRLKERIKFLHGSLTYKDERMYGFDAATCVEVIEHMDLPRLEAFERVLFEFARPGLVVITTPNSEYNCKFENLPAGRFRHKDHRFEWTRSEFQSWCNSVAERFSYSIRFLPVGDEDAEVGSPTQMGIFTRCA